MILRKIQQYIGEAVAADAWLSENGYVAIAEDLGDPVAMIDDALSRTDTCVFITTPKFTATSDAARNMVGEAKVVVQLIEKPSLNRSRATWKTAQDAAEYIAWTLNLHTLPDNIGLLVCTLIDSRMLEADTLAYSVEFKIKTHISNPIEED